MAREGDGRPPASAFVEAEAEESGEEGAGEDEEEKDDDGRDLEGFITNEPEKEDAEGSSSSDEEPMDEELHEDDLKVLQDAGLDVSQVQSQRRAREGGSEGERPGKRARGDKDDLEEELFGDFDDDGPTGAVVPAATQDDDEDVFAGLSEDDVDDFVVEDQGAAERRGQAAEFNISEDQLQEVVDIFGDTSVLRPIDEIGEEELEEPLLPEKLPEEGALVPAPEERQEAEAERIEVPEENMEMDPDLKIKLYETKRDFLLEVRDAPERWIQAYEAEPELLDRDLVRRWTDEEHECEAKWIYNEAFWNKDYERPASEAATRQILGMLHTQMLEPIYVVMQHSWQFGRLFTTEDIWKIAELDRQWQSIWILYRRLTEWIHKVEDGQLPIWITAKVDQRIWDNGYAETDLKDTYDWFCVAYPEIAAADGKTGLTASEVQKLALARQHRFDEKLGIKESIEEMSLQVFGITPAELGDNVENGKQVHSPSVELDNEQKYTVDGVCRDHLTSTYQSPEAVQEAVMMYLSRLIASDPRVRRYVRKEFWKMCAVSTTPTEAGKAVALDAAHSFRRQYRAFHLVNRPVHLMGNDELFLDVLWLQRKGFINVEYSMVVEDARNRETNPNAYKLVMLGHDDSDIIRDRRRLVEHFNQMQAGEYVPQTDEEVTKWNWCKATIPRLEAVSRAHEIENRRKGAKDSDSNEKANALFKCSFMTFSADHLNQFVTLDTIFTNLLKLYCSVEEQGNNEYFVVPGEWNDVRKRIILRTLRDELYPMLWQEVQVHLAKKAEEVVCRQCCDKLLKIVDVQPWHLTEQAIREQRDEDKLKYAADIDDMNAFAPSDDDDDPEWAREKKFRLAGACSMLVVMNDVSSASSETAVVALINAFGDPVDMRVLFKGFHHPKEVEPSQDHRYLKYQKMLEHKETFKSLLRKHKPAIVLLPVTDRDVAMMRDHIQAIIDDPEMAKSFKMKPTILMGDPSVSRVVAYHSRAIEEGVYRDCELPLQRIAISCARFVQDPLAETCQLWHEIPEENGIFRLRLHRLQHAVPKDRLGRAIMVPLMEALAKTGLHINKIRRSPHLASLATLLAGFGPRKVRLFKKCLADAVTSRAGLAKLIAKFLHRPGGKDPSKSPVVANAMPFIKICPDLRDAWSPDTIRGLDRTRLGENYRPWISVLCREALKLAEEQEGSGLEPDQDPHARSRKISQDPLAQAIGEHARKGNMERVLQEVNLDEWQALAGIPDLPDVADLDALLTTLIPEVLEPYRDQRQEFLALEDQQAFYLTIGDTEDNVALGSVVHTVVRNDMSTPTADGKEGKPMVVVHILPSMVRGTFRKMHNMNKDQAGYITGCERKFERDESVIARVIDIFATPGRPYNVNLSVDPDASLWSKRFPIQDDDAPFFVPVVSENWTHIKLGLVDTSKAQQSEALKDWVRRPRNIRHTNWTDADHGRALHIINHYLLGNVLFRPSRRHDAIVAMLKVRNTETSGDDPVPVEKCFRTFDVLEKSEKTVSKGFEIAKELECEGVIYGNFDEIIARHMDPIMENLRLFQEHSHHGLQSGAVTDRYEVREALAEFTRKDKKMLHYVLILHDELVGHGLLSWALGGHRPREELIEITPNGYTLWCSCFETIGALVKWFKTVGWRNATRCRKDFKEAWAKRKKEASNRRGEDAFADRKEKMGFKSWAPETTARGGLQTPGGAAAGTPSLYGPEAAAPTPGGFGTPAGGLATPSGLATPAGYAGGYRTPDPRMAPGSPAPMKTMPMTPAGLRGGTASAATPGAALFGRGQGGAVPATPNQAFMQGAAPGTAMPNRLAATPTGLAGSGARGQPVPMTPVGPGAFGAAAAATPAGMGGMGPMTPALGGRGFAPQTPAGNMGPTGRIPRTPQGNAGVGPGAVPMTPAGGGAPATPAGFTPMSPGPMQVSRGGAPVPVTPAGYQPMSPAPLAGGRPGGPNPRTPAEPVPMTPGTAVTPATPATPKTPGQPSTPK